MSHSPNYLRHAAKHRHRVRLSNGRTAVLQSVRGNRARVTYDGTGASYTVPLEGVATVEDPDRGVVIEPDPMRWDTPAPPEPRVPLADRTIDLRGTIT